MMVGVGFSAAAWFALRWIWSVLALLLAGALLAEAPPGGGTGGGATALTPEGNHLGPPPHSVGKR